MIFYRAARPLNETAILSLLSGSQEFAEIIVSFLKRLRAIVLRTFWVPSWVLEGASMGEGHRDSARLRGSAERLQATEGEITLAAASDKLRL